MSVGASGSLFGFIGCDISETATIWDTLLPQVKYSKVMSWLIVIILSFSGGFGRQSVDNYAHLGGLFSGILIGFALFANNFRTSTYQRYVPIACYSTLVLFALISVICLFTVVAAKV